MTVISERQKPYVPQNLRDSFGQREIPAREETAMDVINGLEGLHIPQMRDLYFYHLWHQDRGSALQKIKYLVGEIREDEVDRVLVRVEGNNLLTEKYAVFHSEFLKRTSNERIPEFKRLRRSGMTIEDAAAEAEIDQFLAQKIDTQTSYELFIAEIKRGISRFQAVETANINNSDAQDLLLSLLLEKHVHSVDILEFKKEGLNNRQIVQRVGESIHDVDNLTRAFVFFDILPPHKLRAKETVGQNDFIRKVLHLRSEGLGNQAIAQKLNITLFKVEDAAKFLLWVGLIDPISKSDALRTRWGREKYKNELTGLISKLGYENLHKYNGRVSVRKLYEISGTSMGYDLFLSLYHELEKSKVVPSSRKYKKTNRK